MRLFGVEVFLWDGVKIKNSLRLGRSEISEFRKLKTLPTLVK